MAGDGGYGIPGADALTSFWSDFFSKMTSAGTSTAQPQADVAQRMRKAFFEAFAKYAEEYMRSEAFLTMMKQSMDHALAWQQAMNQMLQKGLTATQIPSREDADHVVMLVRGMEDRLMARLDEMSRRIDRIEKNRASRASEADSSGGKN